MSEERCEKGVFVNGPTPNAPWCTEHDQPWEECYEYLRALLAEERRKASRGDCGETPCAYVGGFCFRHRAEAAEKKLAEVPKELRQVFDRLTYLADSEEDGETAINWPAFAAWANSRYRVLLASLAKKEAEP